MVARTYDMDDTREERDRFNWWPLLVLPIVFFAGWGTNEAMDTDTNQVTNPGIEYGVGGAPGTQCITPGFDQ